MQQIKHHRFSHEIARANVPLYERLLKIKSGQTLHERTSIEGKIPDNLQKHHGSVKASKKLQPFWRAIGEETEPDPVDMRFYMRSSSISAPPLCDCGALCELRGIKYTHTDSTDGPGLNSRKNNLLMMSCRGHNFQKSNPESTICFYLSYFCAVNSTFVFPVLSFLFLFFFIFPTLCSNSRWTNFR